SFFFQAEDGIRDFHVTGVQTCALPILNAGRWDYLFSIIKMFRDRGRRRVLPDRSQLTMTVPFMRAYAELLVATCHRRGAHAIGEIGRASCRGRVDVMAIAAPASPRHDR